MALLDENARRVADVLREWEAYIELREQEVILYRRARDMREAWEAAHQQVSQAQRRFDSAMRLLADYFDNIKVHFPEARRHPGSYARSLMDGHGISRAEAVKRTAEHAGLSVSYVRKRLHELEQAEGPSPDALRLLGGGKG
jgi:hypothetical protein